LTADLTQNYSCAAAARRRNQPSPKEVPGAKVLVASVVYRQWG